MFVDPCKPLHAHSVSVVLDHLRGGSRSCDRPAMNRLCPSQIPCRAHRPGSRASSKRPAHHPYRYGSCSSQMSREWIPVRLCMPFLPLIAHHPRVQRYSFATKPSALEIGCSCRASQKPGSTNYEFFRLFGRGERANQTTGVPVLEVSSSDPFLLIEIYFTADELQNVDGSLAIPAVELVCDSILLPLHREFTHSTPRFLCLPTA